MDTNKTVLSHTQVALPGGGMVLLLETGARIGPEEVAMLQALYSRDPGSVVDHLAKVDEVGAEKFMNQFYVGYGHQSIGDCGHITLFIEGVSMLAAKAVQDFMLYAGQEVSTRYVDFSNQRFITKYPLEGWPERFREFYVRSLPLLVQYLQEKHPRGEEEKEATWVRAINARAFDILRSFLPAGATTSLAWHANLRKAREHTAQLRNHALKEVRVIGRAIERVLLERHPASFADGKVTDAVVPKHYEQSEEYLAGYMSDKYYLCDKHCSEFALLQNNVVLAPTDLEFLALRPRHTEIPKAFAECGTMQFEFLLDFASFRDIQRQRSIIQRMPLLTTDYGFHPWYLMQLPSSIRDEAENLLRGFEDDAAHVLTHLGSPMSVLTEMQYNIPMGYCVPQRITGDLPAMVYVAELRTSQTVHPTLREPAQKIAREIETALGIPVYADYEPDRFSVKRGDQTILKK